MQLCCSMRRVQLFALVVASVTIVSVLVILFLFNYPSFAKQRVIQEMVFKNGSLSMTRFQTTADLTNLRLSFYVFNVTNPYDVVNNSAKIELQEIGPFVYHEFKHREFLDNNQTSGLITYKLMKRFNFQRHLSVADPKTSKIFWPNVPLIVARNFVDKLPFFEKTAAYLAINSAIGYLKEPAFMNDTIENFIFNGSKRNLFEQLQKMDIFDMIHPWPLKDNKFALLYQKNDTWDPTKDHVFTTSAGFGLNQTYKDLNNYIYMNGSSVLPYWNSNPPNCNQIGGTDGEFFSPFLNQNEDLNIYSIDICRKLKLKFEQNATISGIQVLKYTLDQKTFQSGRNNSENLCYCLARDSSGIPKPECDLDGLIDLSTCVAPNVVASGAHFLAGSKSLLDRLPSISPPNSSVHDPTIFIEPNTGLTIQVKVPIQLNVRLEKGGFSLFKFFNEDSPLIIPLLWVSEQAEMTDDQASQLRGKLLFLDSWFVIMVLGGAIIFVVAIIVIAAVLCISYRKSRRVHHEASSETEPLLNSTSIENQGDILNDNSQSSDNARNYRTV